MANPLPTSTRAPGGWLGFWVGILVTVGLVAALVQLWPDDDPRTIGSSAPVKPTTRSGVPELPEGFPELPDGVTAPTGPAAQLFTAGVPEAVAAVLDADHSGGPIDEIAVYPSYLIVTHPDPNDPSRLVRRAWRNGAPETGAASPTHRRRWCA